MKHLTNHHPIEGDSALTQNRRVIAGILITAGILAILIALCQYNTQYRAKVKTGEEQAQTSR
ncbi:hypothetical protein GCM10028807_62830 [Spirosoma daeguense]